MKAFSYGFVYAIPHAKSKSVNFDTCLASGPHMRLDQADEIEAATRGQTLLKKALMQQP
jgi:hypothetical protein